MYYVIRCKNRGNATKSYVEKIIFTTYYVELASDRVPCQKNRGMMKLMVIPDVDPTTGGADYVCIC